MMLYIAVIHTLLLLVNQVTGVEDDYFIYYEDLGCGELKTDDSYVCTYDGDDTKFGAKATCSCREGFVTEDDVNLECTEPGNWLPALPKCQKVDCGPPLILDPTYNCLFVRNQTYYQDTTVCTCSDGYRWEDGGSQTTITCLANRSWSNILIRCYEQYCPLQVNNSLNVVCQELKTVKPGTTLKCRCQDGFTWSTNVARGEVVELTCRITTTFEPELIPCKDDGFLTQLQRLAVRDLPIAIGIIAGVLVVAIAGRCYIIYRWKRKQRQYRATNINPGLLAAARNLTSVPLKQHQLFNKEPTSKQLKGTGKRRYAPKRRRS